METSSAVPPPVPVLIHEYAEKGPLEELKRLVEEGVSMETVDINGWGPLHFAASAGNTEAAEYLIAKGAAIDVPDKNGKTPLHLASMKGNTIITALLCRNGADINRRNSSGFTPLLYAAESGHFDVVELLCEHEADVTVTDNAGNSALHYACGNNNLEIAKLLLEHVYAIIVRTNNFGNTPLHLACSNGALDVVKFLVELRPELVDAPNRDGNIPLHFASERGHIDIVEFLLDNESNIDEENNLGNTPLLSASSQPFKSTAVMIPVLQTLMAKGAKLDIENVYHKTAFDFQLFRKAIATYIPESCEKLTHVQKLNDDYADQIVKLKAKITDAKEKMSLLVKNYVEEREQAKKLTGANETLQGELTKVKEELAETKNRVAELERVNECLRGILQLREMTKSRSQMKLTLEVSSDDEGLDDDFSVMSPISTENSGSDENPCTIRDYQNLLRQFYDVTVSEYTTPLFQEMSKLPRLSSYNPRLSFGTQGELQILAFTSQGTKHIKEVSESFHSREALRKKLQDLLAVMNNSEGATHIPKLSEQYSTLTNVRSELEAKLKKKRDKLQADWDSIQAKAAKFGSIYVKAKAKLERQQRAFLNAMDENNKRYDAIRSELQKRIDALDSQLLDFDTVFVEISDRFEMQLDICLTRLQQQQISLAQEMLTADSPVSKKEVLVKIQAVSSGLNAVFEALNKVQSMKTEFMEKVKPAVRHSPEPVALGKCSSSGGSDVDLSKIEWVLV